MHLGVRFPICTPAREFNYLQPTAVDNRKHSAQRLPKSWQVESEANKRAELTLYLCGAERYFIRLIDEEQLRSGLFPILNSPDLLLSRCAERIEMGAAALPHTIL